MGHLLVDVRTRNTSIVVGVNGILDVSTVEELAEAVQPHLHAEADVQVDFSGVSLCDSTGLGAVVRLERRARAVGCSFAIVNPCPRVADILAMTGIDQVVHVRYTPDAHAS